MSDLLDKPDKRFYDIDKEKYIENIMGEYRQLNKEILDSCEVLTNIEPVQKVETIFDTSIKKKRK
jgi:hypothetical protein